MLSRLRSPLPRLERLARNRSEATSLDRAHVRFSYAAVSVDSQRVRTENPLRLCGCGGSATKPFCITPTSISLRRAATAGTSSLAIAHCRPPVAPFPPLTARSDPERRVTVSMFLTRHVVLGSMPTTPFCLASHARTSAGSGARSPAAARSRYSSAAVLERGLVRRRAAFRTHRVPSRHEITLSFIPTMFTRSSVVSNLLPFPLSSRCSSPRSPSRTRRKSLLKTRQEARLL